MSTHTFNNHSFTSARGNPVTVFNVKPVETNVTGMWGFGKVVRTFAVVCGVEVEIERGCAFKASSAVAAAGF